MSYGENKLKHKRRKASKKVVKPFVRVAQIPSRPYELALEADVHEAGGILVNSCLPSMLSRVRASSPAYFD